MQTLSLNPHTGHSLPLPVLCSSLADWLESGSGAMKNALYIDLFISELRDTTVDDKTVVGEKDNKVKSDSSNGSNGSGAGGGRLGGRGGWGRVVLNKNIRSEETKVVSRTEDLISGGENNNKNGSTADLMSRCNGRLQRTKRIDDGDTGDDKDSIASVTIISVPSSIVTPVTQPGN